MHGLKHKADRQESEKERPCLPRNESDDNEKYLIWYSYAFLVKVEEEIFHFESL